MKKLIVLSLCLILLLSICGCSKTDNSISSNVSSNTESIEETNNMQQTETTKTVINKDITLSSEEKRLLIFYIITKMNGMIIIQLMVLKDVL